MPDASGIYQSRIFPGLWIDELGLLDSNDALMKETIEQGLSTAEHDNFVARLATPRL
ncbi:MAG TPA: hypothetical protein V6D08_09705 [Candidatus Obscuribacterales bacterium]